jgi:hypothetical protein
MVIEVSDTVESARSPAAGSVTDDRPIGSGSPPRFQSFFQDAFMQMETMPEPSITSTVIDD